MQSSVSIVILTVMERFSEKEPTEQIPNWCTLQTLDKRTQLEIRKAIQKRMLLVSSPLILDAVEGLIVLLPYYSHLISCVGSFLRNVKIVQKLFPSET